MADSKKEDTKRRLADPSISFSEMGLQEIIDHEFFNDDTVADMDLIDLAAKRLAEMRGISTESQYKETAYEALRKLFKQGI